MHIGNLCGKLFNIDLLKQIMIVIVQFLSSSHLVRMANLCRKVVYNRITHSAVNASHFTADYSTVS